MSNLPPPPGPGQSPYGQQPGQPAYGQPPPQAPYGQPPYGQYGQQVPPAYGYGGYGNPLQAPKNNGLAIAGMICGIVGVTVGLCLWGTPGIIGLVLSIIGLRQINASQGQQTGKGMAIAGIVTGGLSALFFLTLLVAVAVGDSSGTT